MTSLGNWVTAKEIAGLAGLPTAISSVLRKAKRENWVFRQKSGIKGIAYEFQLDCLPSHVQDSIRERYLNSLLTAEKKAIKTAVKGDLNPRVKASQELDLMRQCPALLERSTGNLTKLQRDIADARATLVIEVFALQNAGLSRIRAIKYICDQSQSNTLPENLQKAAVAANARKGLRTGVSTRTLNGWVAH